MSEVFLSEAMLGRMFWTDLTGSTRNAEAASDVANVIFPHSEQVGQGFPTQTGSISRRSAELLWLIARYFRPKTIAEVGTFIGRSTLSLYQGAKPSLEMLATCDFSYDTWRAPPGDAANKIRYFGKTSSTQMFQTLAAEKKKIDLFLIDGRLAQEDLPLLDTLVHDRTIFVLDDFEGIEKGVANALMLRQKYNGLLLLVPENPPHAGWNESHSIALMFSAGIIRLTRQQRLPLELM